MDLKLLREATRPEHEATEAAVPLVGSGLTRTKYLEVLRRFYGVVCAWDTVADSESPAAYADLVQQRRRSESLAADLLFFGESPAVSAPESLLRQMRALIGNHSPSAADAHAYRFLGAMYVVEGSTLGGQYIAHQVETSLGLEPGAGDRFFRGYGKETMPKWREFQQALTAVPDEHGDAVIAAAKQMFTIFRDWLSQDATAGSISIPNLQKTSRGGEAEAS